MTVVPGGKSFDVLLLMAVSAACFLPVLLVGPPAGTADLFHHLAIANAYYESFHHGDLLPNWIFAGNHGFGAVTTRFYPPLAHVTMAAFRSATQTWTSAVFATFAFWSFVGSFGVYRWVKDIQPSRVAALAAALFFAITPYHMNQFYHSFMWGEFVALSVMPFSFLFLRRITKAGSWENVLGLAVSLALLVLSNIPQTVVGLISLAIYFLLLAERRTILHSALRVLLAGLLAAVLTSFFWVRISYEMHWIKIGQPNTDPWFNPLNNFLFTSLEVDDRFLWFAGLIAVLQIGLLIVAIAGSGSYRTFFSDRDRRAVSGVILASLFLTTAASAFIWSNVEALSRIQFPWRFLSTISLCFSVLMGFAWSSIDKNAWAERRPAVLIIAGTFFILLSFTVKQDILAAGYTAPGSFEAIVSNSSRDVGLEHWHPTWTSLRTFSEDERVTLGTERTLSITQWDEHKREFIIGEGEPTIARTAIMYYPHWQATVNGSSAATSEIGGALAVDVPGEESIIELRFVEPRYTSISRWISLLAWSAVGLAAVTLKLRKRSPLT